ncbi:MAG: hypothetical protein QG635_2035, partial [Bacteroidota bacterium]|nr:hypothetical protein [Bacteroidota bacterium]
MKKVITIILSVILFSSACSENAPLTNPDTITIATFNIQWLGDGFDDIKPRSSKDYDNIADIIRDLKADIIAVEEVENSAALKIILNRIDGYDFFISNKGSKQNVGIIYRKDISVESLGDYMPLEVSSGETRPGFIVKAQKGNFDFILMAVHFKSTSSYDSTAELKEKSRELRSLQAEATVHWADSIISIGNENNIIIAGDFNDYP